MSVTCEKCGADIAWEGDYHPNCDTVVALRLALKEALDWWHRYMEDGMPVSVEEEDVHEKRIAELRKQFDLE